MRPAAASQSPAREGAKSVGELCNDGGSRRWCRAMWGRKRMGGKVAGKAEADAGILVSRAEQTNAPDLHPKIAPFLRKCLEHKVKPIRR